MKLHLSVSAIDPWNERLDAALAKSRPRAPQVPGGLYYVVKHNGCTGRPIFGNAFDYAVFEQLLVLALARYRCRLHAFYWEPDAIHLAIQVSDRPIGRLLRWVCGWYSRSVSKRAGDEVLFERSYRAVLIEPEALLRLVRYLHLRPVGRGAGAESVDSALSSHRAYLGVVHIPWLTTSVALGMLGECLEEGRIEYREMMQAKENRAPAFAAVERRRQTHSESFDLPSLTILNMESLQIRAVPVTVGKWS